MPYSTLMVHVDLDKHDEVRIQVAADLAAQLDARLIGIAASDVALAPYFMLGSEAQALIDEEHAGLKTRLTEAEQRFRQKLHNRVKQLEWRSAVDSPTGYVARQARAADLLIVGPERGITLDPLRHLHSSDLVMQAGRPLLVVPENGAAPSLKSVLVAWKDTRESRRAVRDALPLLTVAANVTVVEVCEEHELFPEAEAHVKDVTTWLAGHHVTATGMAWPALHDAPGQIDAVARDVGADLIVAGAYGHSRLGEWVFGGVTRNLLTHSKQCSLLAH